MMRKYIFRVLIVLCFFLQGCATTRVIGKATYKNFPKEVTDKQLCVIHENTCSQLYNGQAYIDCMKPCCEIWEIKTCETWENKLKESNGINY